MFPVACASNACDGAKPPQSSVLATSLGIQEVCLEARHQCCRRCAIIQERILHWEWQSCGSLPGSQLEVALRLSHELTTSVQKFTEAVEQDDHEGMEQIALQRHDCGLLLDKLVQKHHMIPMVLGSGSAGTVQKYRALVRKVLAESQGFHQCCSTLSAVHSITADLGPEAGIADLCLPSVMAVESWLCSSQQNETLEIDVESADALSSMMVAIDNNQSTLA